MSNKREFGFKLKIDGDISDILSSLEALQSAFDKVEMPDSLTKALTKDITNAIQKVGEFGKKSEAAINSLSDSKEITNAWKSVQKELNALEVKLEGIDSSKLFPKEVTDNLNKATSAAEKYIKALEGSKSSEQFQRKLGELNRIAEQERANETLRKKAHQSEVQTEAVYSQRKAQWTEQINQQYEEQQAAIAQANKKLEEQKDIVKQLVDEQTKLQAEGYLSKQNQPYAKKNEAAKQLTQAEIEVTSTGRSVSAAKGQVTRYENKNSGKSLKNDEEYLKLKQKLTEAENKHKTALEKVQELKSKVGDTKKLNRANEIGVEITKAKEYQRTLEGEATAAKNAATDLGEQKRALDQSKEAYEAAATEAAGYQIQLDKLGAESEELNKDLKKIQTDAAEKEWQDLVQVVKEFTGIDLSESAHDMEAFTNAINQYRQGEINKLPETLKEILANTKPIPEAVGKIGDELREMGDDVKSATDAANEMDNLKRQVMDFFSITNSIQLFKRAVTSALNTIKELDATMTEAAVVTEFDVGDMWEKLPQYSKEAQNLGVSINGMYQATTLYYQQGLKNQEAMELGIETMKMGKIAAMDSTEATKAMTAALRGFNMELNEMSATRVNDVYSQLAAVTAADTNQIATAMEKTASIAASANMEFETTAAFLAQIIETTQEAPETAGTALKTIIARFAEVKSLREQGLLTGEDEEGEIIDVNKIQTALRSVGISMEGFFSGKEGLDSVLLKLAEKWNTLDFETQRYIATMAAGSRQQSRFIAMMSDYKRTTELVGQAQNSTGASQKQFQKTQESLETSLTKLKNAWDEFLMGLANNEVLKAGVDGLTKILETINKITEGISGGNGLIKSVVSLGGVLATLNTGRVMLKGTAIGNTMGGLLNKIKVPKTQTQKLGFKQRFTSIEETGKNALIEKMKKTGAVAKGNEAELAKLTDSLDKGEISAEECAKGFEKLGGKLEGIDPSAKQVVYNMQNIGAAVSTAGMAVMGLGAATSLLAQYFESQGLEEEAEAIQEISGLLMGIGSTLMVVGQLLPIITAQSWAALLPWLAIAAAIAVVIGLVVQYSKDKHAKSLEGRMEAAAKATEKAKEAAEGAKKTYDDLLESKNTYEELQNQLDSLTKTTLEWKQALMESNAEVLSLVNTYPELAKYLTKGEYGQLQISIEGWDAIIEQQQQSISNANAAMLTSQMDEMRLKNEKVEKKKEWQQSTVDAISKPLLQKLFDPTKQYLNSANAELARFEAALAESELALQSQAEAILANVVDEKTLTHEFGDEVISAMAGGFVKQQQQKENEIYESLLATPGTMGTAAETIEKIGREAGVSELGLSGWYADDVRAVYAKLTGTTVDKIDPDTDIDVLVKSIASIQAAKEVGVQTDKIMSKFSTLDRDTQQKYSVVMSKDISNATREFYDKEEGVSLEQIAQDLELTMDELLDAFGYESQKAMSEALNNLKEETKKAFGEIENLAEISGVSTNKSYLKNATTSQLGSYVDLLSFSIFTGGNKSIEEGFEEIFSTVTEKQKEQILTMMETVDWTREGSAENFIEDLKTLGIVFDESDPKIEAFIKQLDLANSVFRDFDLNSILNQTKEELEEIAEIAGQKELTTEQYDAFVKSGMIKDESEWSWNGKGWVNVTNGMDNLVTALKNNTAATLQLTKDEAKNQIDFYESSNEKFSREMNSMLGRGLQREAVSFQESILSGTATKANWSRLFNSQKEYEQWLELRNGGIDEVRRTYNILGDFDITSFDISDSKKDPYDKYYNTYEILGTIAKQRERIEKRRNSLLEEGNAKIAKEERDAYKTKLGEEWNLQDNIVKGKSFDIQELLKKETYAKGDSDLKMLEDGTIWFNQDKVNNFDPARREQFDNLLKQVESMRDQMREAEDALLDIENDIDKIEDEDRQAYMDATNRIKEALILQRQEEIDKLKEINDSINNTNAKILQSMQDQIAESRQARDNAKTEEELSEKQRRLAYLQQDTSGANAMEILKLQKEIEEGQESYTDRLIDQKISELQKQNDQAAEQRERQIEILEAQKQLWEQGAIWERVEELFGDAFTAEGAVNESSELFQILKQYGDFDSMSSAEQSAFIEEVKKILASAYGIHYATGGLASFTGPAWLDGTKSRPEYVLNADQTQAFFELVDVLGSLRAEGKTSQISGDSIFDIDINVETIGSDYDVEQMANKIKDIIVGSSRYRNNNIL